MPAFSRAASRAATASRAVAVEAEAVDHRLIGIQPKKTRLRIARLRLRRHAPDLDEAEAEPQQRVRHLGVLVEPGREPDRIGERQPERLHAQLFVVRRGPRQRRELQRVQRQPMRDFGIERAQQRPGKTIEQGDHRSSSGNTCNPSVPSGSGFTQRTADIGSVP